mgnify:CR=1 FL=1
MEPALVQAMNDTVVEPQTCAFWWLGQHSFTVKLSTSICYIDPFLTPLAGRLVPPQLHPKEVTNAVIVLGTHDHADHIDRPAWPIIAAASPEAVFVVPLLLRDRIISELGLSSSRVIGIDDGTSIAIGDVQVTGVPAAHEFLDVDTNTGLHPYLGYVLTGGGFSLYHSGDSCIYEGLQAKLRQYELGLAFLPINGRDAKRLRANCIGNMTYQEAADLAGAIRPGLTVPSHFDMFATNHEDPELFIDYMRIKYPDVRTLIPRHYERYVGGVPKDIF